MNRNAGRVLVPIEQISSTILLIRGQRVLLDNELAALYAAPARRRAVEHRLEEAVAKVVGTPVLPGAILIDIPKPEKWRTDVLVSFSRPPIGFEPVMAWREVAGLADADLKRYEDHRRLIRIVTTADVREIVREQWESILPAALGN